MSIQQGRLQESPLQDAPARISGNLRAAAQSGMQRTTGKLLATQGYVVGIEISGSGARQSVALADLNGTILQRVRRPLEYVADTKTVLQLLDGMLAEVMAPDHLEDGRVLRVGVAIGGLVDATHGVVRTLHHAHGWDNFPLQDYLAERLDIPCIIDNNANAAALAEVQYGAGIGERIVLYVGLGRGIGGGMIINGRVYHGTTCTAGEIGHLLVKENGPRCSCGGFGHLEAIASERITAEQVFRLAAEGDRVAQRIVDDVHTYLGIALANIVHLINPGMIILGGQVAQAGDLLIVPLQARIRDLCLPAASEDLRVVQGRLGTEANIVGAVTLALQDI